jgi:hypothetical protein
LIIGNNKYKSLYLTQPLVTRLTRLIHNYFFDFTRASAAQDSSESSVLLDETQLIELTNQILIVFGSFSLGNLEHVTQLVKVYNIHELLFGIVKSMLERLEISASAIFSKQTNVNGPASDSTTTTTTTTKQYIRLIESGLLCLSNLYSSSQLMPKLIYLLDKQLYQAATDTGGAARAGGNSTTATTDHSQYHQPASNLNSLIKFFHVSSRGKQAVLNIITLSSVNLMSTSCFLLRKETSNFKKYRALLIKSDVVKLFAGLLTSFNAKLQLNCLKFYASISFECLEATRQILATQYYEFGLVDLISAYLSRENQTELQLYAAKCLTNLYRSSLLIENDLSELMDTQPLDGSSRGVSSPLKLINNQLIRAKTMPALVRLCVRFSVTINLVFQYFLLSRQETFRYGVEGSYLG